MFPDLTGYGWNGSRYYDLDSGRFISSETVREALDNVSDAAAVNMNILSQQLIDGAISLPDWQAGMMENIKIAHTAATAAANGGWAQVSPSDWGTAGADIKAQYQYLQDFANQIANGEQALDGRLMVRSDMYGDAARGTFEDIRQKAVIDEGYEEGRRVLEAGADHCDDCEEYANDGWIPIDEIPDIGDSQCMTRCKCTIEYRRMGEDGEWEILK